MPRESVLPWLTTAALPAWNQQLIALSDGSLAAGRYNECGETCVAAIVAAVWGVPVSPDQIRAGDGGPGRGPLTTAADLVFMLRSCNVQAYAYNSPAAVAWGNIKAATTDGQPVIMLGTWPTPGGALHWLVATSISDGKVFYNNPWNGSRSWLLQADFERLYAGQIVVVNAHLHVNAAGMAQPW